MTSIAESAVYSLRNGFAPAGALGDHGISHDQLLIGLRAILPRSIMIPLLTTGIAYL
jgi:hypothetical protein